MDKRKERLDRENEERIKQKEEEEKRRIKEEEVEKQLLSEVLPAAESADEEW